MSQLKAEKKHLIATHKCIECLEQLPEGAKKCAKCNSYQSSWKNHLNYSAGIVGLFSVGAGALIYLFSQYTNIKKEFYWEDKAAVYEYVGESHVVISNFGDGPIFVKSLSTHFQLEKGANVEDEVLVGTSIDKNTVKLITLPSHKERQTIESKFSDVPEFDSLADYNLANNFSGTMKEMNEGKKCYLRTITEADSNIIKLFRSHSRKKFYTSNGVGTLQFYSLKNGKLNSTNFTVQSYLQDDDNMGCDLIYSDKLGKLYPLKIK